MNAPIAQLAEQRTCRPQAVSSILTRGSTGDWYCPICGVRLCRRHYRDGE